jgi:pyruvate dehydrogenase E1 component alpha subunit
MMLIRRFEEKAAQMYAMAKIGGFCHLYIGEEAIAVGAVSTLKDNDYVVAPYRDHGHALARGCNPNKVMAELFGKADGLCKGKGGSMHLFDIKRRFMGGYAIVGGQLPIATGIAYAIKYRDRKEVVLCFLGEGAVNEGAFHESLNVAALWKLPIVYLCENNLYAMGTAVERASAVADIYERACSYDMPRQRVDGMDLLTVREEVGKAVKLARQQRMPSFIEASTYRFKGHSMSDPARYRSKEEVEQMKAKDPILIFQEKMLNEGLMKEEEITKLDNKAKKIAQEAVEYAEAAADPESASLYQDVLV